MFDPKIVTPPFRRTEATRDAATASETTGRYPTVRMRRNRSGDGEHTSSTCDFHEHEHQHSHEN